MTDETRDDFKKKLAVEIVARYTRMGRGLDISRKAFIDGAEWALPIAEKAGYERALRELKNISNLGEDEEKSIREFLEFKFRKSN